ncbi:hypothetical protein QBC37DRAFT_401245 [Rhypophila decipiens]|uniref:PLD phosphodiesterase domain-containing protein n=1 Tax=Rhypophila decipiens TaxID=261697 RepID=A0AAN7B717_9PEZI|nr:hypothetical protein QBC37DRAFT_401245 [Rhypophila decipiens]
MLSPSLADLELELKTLGPPGSSYSLGRSSKLSVKDDKDDPFNIFMFIPFGRWSHEADKLEAKRSVIADSFKEVLDVGLAGDIADKVCLIDLALLNEPEDAFMHENAAGAGSMITHLIDALNLPKVREAKVVVRLLVGSADQEQRRANFLSGQNDWNRLARYKALFWGNNGQSLTNHPDATLLIGYYNPTLVIDPNPPEEGSVLRKLEAFLDGVDKIPGTEANSPPGFFHSLGGLSAKVRHLEHYARTTGLPAMSWNHAKFAAVNGRSMMTGGFNYWDDYLSKNNLATNTAQNNRLYDFGIKMQGNAAIAVHNFADEMWSYLAHIDLHKDARSMAWSAKLGVDKPLFMAATADDIQVSLGRFPFDKAPKAQEGIQVLSIGRVGSMMLDKYRYPAQLLDGFSDIWHNVAWHLSAAEPILTERGNGIADSVNLLNDTSKSLKGILASSMGTSPAAWASKHARLWAIANAQTSIHIATETLVEILHNDKWTDLVSEVNSTFSLTQDKRWDGVLWPYVAMAQALSRFAALPAPAKDDKQPAKNALYLVVSCYDVNPDGYGDHARISDLKRRLKSTMRYMAWKDENQSSSNLLPVKVKASDVDGIVDRHFLVKRIGTTTSYKMHAKTICIDRSLLYVGSDNPYPHYNQEFGCWIEDPPSVASFFAEFYDGIWERSVYTD